MFLAAADPLASPGGDTAWILTSAALVLLMTPGLAFFYGGMARAKTALNMIMMSVITIGIVSVLWIFYGFSVAFGDTGNGFWGGLSDVGLGELIGKVTTNGAVYPIPALAFSMFQLMFAIITPALISGAIADRAKFLSWGIFVTFWVTIVYFPVAHWVFDFGGHGARRRLARAIRVLRTSQEVPRSTSTPVLRTRPRDRPGRRHGWPNRRCDTRIGL